jgi:hypothetical protein
MTLQRVINIVSESAMFLPAIAVVGAWLWINNAQKRKMRIENNLRENDEVPASDETSEKKNG